MATDPVRASLATLQSLVDDVDTFLFDCDGVIWDRDSLFPHIKEGLEYLRSRNKRLLFVTNNSSKTGEDFRCKFESLGIPVNLEDIVGSSFVAAWYLKKLASEKRLDREKDEILVVGAQGLAHEIQSVGFNVFSIPNASTYATIHELATFPIPPQVKAVVVGIDFRINMYKIAFASCCIQMNKDCLFIATNRDASFRVADGRLLPGNGAIVSAIETASGRTPIMTGKPSEHLFEFLSEVYNLDPSRCCFVGDRLDTDIAFGRLCGMKTLLVFTGVTSPDILSAEKEHIPTIATESVGDFSKLAHPTRP